MINFLKDGSACPVFCKTLPLSGSNGGGGGGGGTLEMFHMSCTKYHREAFLLQRNR